jgi:hypothetical protein
VTGEDILVLSVKFTLQIISASFHSHTAISSKQIKSYTNLSSQSTTKKKNERKNSAKQKKSLNSSYRFMADTQRRVFEVEA